jgi:AcrR family transcriptional regulator
MARHVEAMPTRDAILEAAIAEFIERGFAGVRTEHVARRVGYNKALVYRWFKDKETLFQEAMKRRFSQRSDCWIRPPRTSAAFSLGGPRSRLRTPNSCA